MTRFCNTHIKQRTEAEVRDYLQEATEKLESLDPRSRRGSMYLRRKIRAKDELIRRGLTP